MRTRLVAALAFASAVECSQLLAFDWLVSLRHTTLGALVLGQGFLWSDLVCYTAGVMLGALSELLVTASPPRHRGS